VRLIIDYGIINVKADVMFNVVRDVKFVDIQYSVSQKNPSPAVF